MELAVYKQGMENSLKDRSSSMAWEVYLRLKNGLGTAAKEGQKKVSM
jgi:hypothetical protein